MVEQTFVLIKPDGFQRGLTSKVLRKMDVKGFKLVAMKMLVPTEEILKKHYAEHVTKGFFPGLVKHMTSGPVVIMIFEGVGVVEATRRMIGATKPSESAPGTIRGDFCIDVGRNGIHGSDSVDSAKSEINLWFLPADLCTYERFDHALIYE